MTRITLFLVSIIILSSCSLKEIAVQVPFQIPDNTRSIVIVNRCLHEDFTDTRDDSWVPKLYYDITACDSALLSAAKIIFDSMRLDVVVPVQRNIFRVARNRILEPLDSAYIRTTCKNFNVDAVLVLEDFSENLKFKVAGISLTTRMVWRYYQPGSIPSSTVINDTLYHFGEFFKKKPSLKDILIEGGINSGRNVARHIGCLWQDQKRYYYKTGKKEIDTAIPLILSDKWEEASDIWLKFSSVSSRSLRSKIQYNLALSADMKGDIGQAMIWANKSLETRKHINTKKYLKELKARKALLNKQPN